MRLTTLIAVAVSSRPTNELCAAYANTHAYTYANGYSHGYADPSANGHALADADSDNRHLWS